MRRPSSGVNANQPPQPGIRAALCEIHCRYNGRDPPPKQTHGRPALRSAPPPPASARPTFLQCGLATALRGQSLIDRLEGRCRRTPPQVIPTRYKQVARKSSLCIALGAISHSAWRRLAHLPAAFPRRAEGTGERAIAVAFQQLSVTAPSVGNAGGKGSSGGNRGGYLEEGSQLTSIVE
jgi:hypothetical protein